MMNPKQLGKTASIAFAASGVIALPGASNIGQYRAITLNPAGAGLTATLPAPTETSVVFGLDVINIGASAVTVTGIGSIAPGASKRAIWNGSSAWAADIAAATAAIPLWVTGTTYAIDALVKDPNTLTIFAAAAAHTAGATPPSQDAVNWLGWDLGQIGQITIGIPARDRNGYLAMTAGRLVSRATYNRLLNTVAPVMNNIGIVAGSNQLRFDPGQRPFLEIGYTLEVPGIPAGTTLTAVGGEGTKVGSTFMAQPFLFFRPGVYGTGFAMSTNTEVDGPGLDPSSTVNALQADFSAITVNVTSGSDLLTGGSGLAQTNPARVGSYVTGPGIPPNARIVLESDGNLNSGGSISIAGRPHVFLAPRAAEDFFGTNAAGLNNIMIGRAVTITGFAADRVITAIAAPQDTIAGSWDYVAPQQLFSPWDITPADFAKFGFGRGRRVGAGTALADTANIATTTTPPLPAFTLNAAVVSGSTSVFYQTGQTLTANFNRKIGNLSGAIPNDAYIVTQTNIDQTGNPIGSINGEAKAFFATGAVTANNSAGTVGQYLTSAGAGFTQARVTGVVAQFNNTGTGVVSGSNSLFVQPSLPITDFSVGQTVSGTGIPANTTFTALGAHETAPGSYWPTGLATWSVQPGAPVYALNRRVQGPGRASSASNAILSAIAETTQPGIGVQGSTRLFFDPAAVLTNIVTNRILDTAIFAANTRTSASALAGSTIANSHIPASTPTRMYLPGGATLPAAGVVGGAVRFAGSEPGYKYSVINAVQASESISGVVANGSDQVNLNILTGGANGPPLSTLPTSILVGRGISGTGIPAGARIGAITKPVATGNGFVNGSNFISSWTGAPLVASDVGRTVAHGSLVGISNGVPLGVITAVNSPTSFTVSINTVVNGGVVGFILGARVSLVDAAGAALNATANNGTAAADNSGNGYGPPVFNLTGAPYLTLAKTATAPGTYTADVLAHVAVVNAAGASTTPTPNADIEANTVIGAVYTLGGAPTAANNYTPATVGAVHTMSATATASGAGVSVTYGRWITTDAPATATLASTAATFGAIYAMSAAATATDLTPITHGAWIEVTGGTTQRGITTGVRLGAILTVGSNATSDNFAGAVFGPYLRMDQNATASASATLTFGGHVGIDVAGISTQIDQTYSFGATWTMSANATVTNQTASGRVFPFGAGDGSTTFGIGTGTITVGATARTLTMYAGA